MITNGSHYNTRDERRGLPQLLTSSEGGPSAEKHQDFLSHETPMQSSNHKNGAVEILDTDYKRRMMNDTPQVMEMIDSTTSQKKKAGLMKNQIQEQISPEMLGSR